MRLFLSTISIVLILANPVFAKEFERLADDISFHYNIDRLSPAGVKFAISLMKPFIFFKGIRKFKVAAFENKDQNIETSLEKLESVVSQSLGSEWKPFLFAKSNRKNSASVIFLQTSRKSMRLMIATIEEDTTALVHMKLSKRAIIKFMDNPEAITGEGE